ncbi:hypothetical protein Lpar_0173 [Legionella parisiensis]|uniref:Uncharacterized protein n=1 Tax=Legionella parisiensis TaxID=45071 RepID=A0A1E5JUA0_9GAMM|nr:hypothetical protein Lpar_0173 [Legionella parisiensis]OEH48075.1 hypothetical protein lpari_00911 [Legionella parisiensis]STX72059.1 Uncharacterised protein [Legionella parisiensis]
MFLKTIILRNLVQVIGKYCCGDFASLSKTQLYTVRHLQWIPKIKILIKSIIYF